MIKTIKDLNQFDDYDRRAKIMPVVIFTIPMLVFMVTGFINKGIMSVITFIVNIAVIYLIGMNVRNLGKTAERKMLLEWGGMQTAILMRHSDNTIDAITKSRYHRFLEQSTNQQLPSEEEERINQNNADRKYQSCIWWLIQRTREDKMVKNNLISYGYIRNLYGLKNIAIIIYLVCIVMNIYLYINNKFDMAVVNIVVFCIWIFMFLILVRKDTAKREAKKYALSLIRKCDSVGDKSC